MSCLVRGQDNGDGSYALPGDGRSPKTDGHLHLTTTPGLPPPF